ncbi:hypothetical protein T459_32451 [Capsicum annuum]|uniref:Uncharacterized protein n=1 Tax=Capsicum annuum TaxID=4072 RepID=A0A2G2Y1Y9_CAPAN|nr:hypothetical protein T459_32451 [Capsicum annuum]
MSKVRVIEGITCIKAKCALFSFFNADLVYTFSDLKPDMNFIEPTSELGWKETKRAMPLIIDPGLYKTTKFDIFWVTPKRDVPTAFKHFTGSAWMILSRAFVEYCIWGWDNIPRNLLLHYSNFVSSPEGYFQTVVCNAPEFTSTVINHDIHYIPGMFLQNSIHTFYPLMTLQT